jgi:hypothetical protein
LISDRPGSLAQMCKLFSTAGASVKDIYHERAWLKSDMFSVQVIYSFLLLNLFSILIGTDSSCIGSA